MKNPKTFKDFAKLAKKNVSPAVKVDFPEREKLNSERIKILDDFNVALPGLYISKNKTILDIGCGCDLVNSIYLRFIQFQNNKFILNDSEEMLNSIKFSHPVKNKKVEKYPGKFPDVPNLFKKYTNKVDYIIINSVLQYVLKEEGDYFEFIDKALELLSPGGYLLLSDLPNKSKAARYFATKEGIKYHQKKNKTKKKPFVEIGPKDIDDWDLVRIVSEYRLKGYDTYLLPMSNQLEFFNRREHILIRKY